MIRDSLVEDKGDTVRKNKSVVVASSDGSEGAGVANGDCVDDLGVAHDFTARGSSVGQECMSEPEEMSQT